MNPKCANYTYMIVINSMVILVVSNTSLRIIVMIDVELMDTLEFKITR